MRNSYLYKNLQPMRIFFILTFFSSFILYSQADTEVFLFDLKKVDGKLDLVNIQNISSNPGYDNQPSFYNNRHILFASTRNSQTDIALYNIKTKTSTFINNTPNGGEYSPTKIPSSKNISAIRLDNDGKQRLYQYNFKTAKSEVLVKDLVIGYHLWASKSKIVSFVLGDIPTLVVSDLKNNRNTIVQKNIGRSLHQIPNTKLISYISKENKTWQIRSLDIKTGESKFLINTIPNSEDMCWLNDGTILMGSGNTIYKYNAKTDTEWIILKSFQNVPFKNITRLAANKSGTALAIVAELTASN
jgi:hypothetical protein